MVPKRDSTPHKPKVLDLIETPPKSSRRERQRAEVLPPVPAVPQGRTIDDAKKEALDIFEDGGKKKSTVIKRSVGKTGKSVLPSISKVLDDQEADLAVDPAVVQEAAPVIEPVPEAPAAEEAHVEAYDPSDPKKVSMKPPIIVSELTARLGLKQFQVMADLVKLKVFVAPNQAIEPDIAAKVCEVHGFEFVRFKRDPEAGVHKQEPVTVQPEKVSPPPEDILKHRAPIITIMGHVDHGKTTLLDAIRKSRVAAGEAGGITQHIGAYQVVHNGFPITFLDTPGHAIFSDMRARGADITDVVILVVAADDGLMPQTIEAINHAKAAKKTVIVAINKCDLPGANIDRVKSQLAEKGLQTTDYGGDTEVAEISALTGKGLDYLLEIMTLQAEVLELKASSAGPAHAAVIEAKLMQGRGPTATVIVKSGTLSVGAPFICGPYYGKIKSMINDRGETVKKAGPAMPVEVVGFESLPNVGDELVVVASEKVAKALAAERQDKHRDERLKSPQRSRMEDLFAMVKEGGQKAQLKIILKCDVQGSVEAIRKAITQIESDKIDTNILTAAAGPITETDIQMASSSDAVVIGFNVKVEANAVRAAKATGVQVKLYSIVYELIDQVREAMLGLLEPETRETITGHAEVKMVFKLSKGRAGGCYVKDGRIHRKAHARVIRGGIPVFDGKMSTLRRFQDEVEEVRNGTECGIRLGDFNEYQEGDIIECYTLEKHAQTL
jgi:translation initiation factor IF-2